MPGRPRENRALDESGLARLRTFPPADARRPMWRKPWLPRNRSGPGVVTRADLGARLLTVKMTARSRCIFGSRCPVTLARRL